MAKSDVGRKAGRFVAPVEFKFGDNDAPGTFGGYGSVYNKQDWHGDIVLPGAFAESLADHKAAGTMPGLFAEHSFAQFGGDPLPIGVWLSMEEDENGLKGIGKISALDTDVGKRMYALMKDGAMPSLSIAYSVNDGGAVMGKKPGEPKRWLKSLKLYSVDVVRDPSNSEASIAYIKSTLAHGDHAAALAAVTQALKLHQQSMTGGDSPTADERSQMHDHLRTAFRALAGEDPKAADRPETIRDFEALLRDAGYSNRLARDIAEHGWKAAHTPREEAASVAEAKATEDAMRSIAEAAELLRGLTFAA